MVHEDQLKSARDAAEALGIKLDDQGNVTRLQLEAQANATRLKEAGTTKKILELQRFINNAISQVHLAAAVPDSGTSSGVHQEFITHLQSVETTMTSMDSGPDSRMARLQLETAILRARAGGQGVQIGRFHFSIYADVKMFVETSMNSNYGGCLDADSLLHSVGGPYVDPGQAVATEASRLRTKYDGQPEVRAVSSFKTSFPAVMFRDSTAASVSAAVAEGCLGPGIGSIDKWDARDGVSGTKIVIENGLRRMEDSIPFEIKENLDGKGADLARECFSLSVGFVHHFATFIDFFYLEMSSAAGFKPKEAWDLVTAVVVKIFSDLREARAVAQESRGAAGFIWGTLQAHMVMKRFLRHSFKRDPGFSAILEQVVLKMLPRC